jgi:hypothetical protein
MPPQAKATAKINFSVIFKRKSKQESSTNFYFQRISSFLVVKTLKRNLFEIERLSMVTTKEKLPPRFTSFFVPFNRKVLLAERNRVKNHL